MIQKVCGSRFMRREVKSNFTLNMAVLTANGRKNTSLLKRQLVKEIY